MKNLSKTKLVSILVLCLAVPTLAGAATLSPAPAAPVADQAVPAPAGPAGDLVVPAADAAPNDDALAGLETGPVNQCIEITVWAKNPDTGECREFPNPCSVPSGWQIFFDPETCSNG